MSIDSILDALDRARSETSFDESGDINSDYDIHSGQGGDIPNRDKFNGEPVTGRGTSFAAYKSSGGTGQKLCEKSTQPAKEIIEEGLRRGLRTCGEVLWEKALSRAEACTSISLSKQRCHPAGSNRVRKIDALLWICADDAC